MTYPVSEGWRLARRTGFSVARQKCSQGALGPGTQPPPKASGSCGAPSFTFQAPSPLPRSTSSSQLLLGTGSRKWSPHFSDRETEAQGRKVAPPKVTQQVRSPERPGWAGGTEARLFGGGGGRGGGWEAPRCVELASGWVPVRCGVPPWDWAAFWGCTASHHEGSYGECSAQTTTFYGPAKCPVLH